jgi:serine/threonine protein kinase
MKTVNVKSLGSCPYLLSLSPSDLIGQGASAEVHRAYNRNDPAQKLAIKIFEIGALKNVESAYQELMVVMELPKHENLVEYKKVKITSKNRIYIVME